MQAKVTAPPCIDRLLGISQSKYTDLIVVHVQTCSMNSREKLYQTDSEADFPEVFRGTRNVETLKGPPSGGA